MLDKFLEVAFTHTKEQEQKVKLAKLMERLPEPLLRKIASGEEKLAYCGSVPCGDSEATWLDRFKGTPLFEQALALEQQDLEMEMQMKQRRQEQDSSWREQDMMRDELRIHRKMLDLELAKLQQGHEEHEAMETPEEEAIEEAALAQHKAQQGQAQGGEQAAAPAAAGGEQKAAAAALRSGKADMAVRKAVRSVVGEGRPKTYALSLMHPSKLKEKQRAKAAIWDQGKKRGRVHGAVAGTAVGAAAMHHHDKKKHEKEQEKESSVDPMLAYKMKMAHALEMKKQALGAELMSGLKGAGSFLGSAAKSVGKAYEGGGFGSALDKMKGLGATAVRKAGRYAASNPGAAAVMGAGALGTAAAGGAAAHKMME